MNVLNSRILVIVAVPLLCAVLAGCAYERPQSTVSPGLVSGVTSQNGGGTRTLGNGVNVGVTTRTSPAY